MDDFIIRAIIGGIGVALAAGPVGCFVIWRRLAYFGAAVAHAALLGVAAGLALGINLMAGVVMVCLAIAALLAAMEGERRLAGDTLIGILAHVALAAGLALIAFQEAVRVDLMGYLFGDVLAIAWRELWLIWGVAAAVLAALAAMWRPLLALTVHEDLAAVEGVRVRLVRTVFMLMVAGVVAVGMQVVGILLIVSLLIVPAAAARAFSATPAMMALIAALIGALSIIGGVFGSLAWDVPAGPAIVLAAGAVFALSLVARHFREARGAARMR
jgi:zinc transport system permease protein